MEDQSHSSLLIEISLCLELRRFLPRNICLHIYVYMCVCGFDCFATKCMRVDESRRTHSSGSLGGRIGWRDTKDNEEYGGIMDISDNLMGSFEIFPIICVFFSLESTNCYVLWRTISYVVQSNTHNSFILIFQYQCNAKAY